MQLNKDVKKATQTLHAICVHILDEDANIQVTRSDIKRVKRVLGIDINLIHHSQIDTIYESKNKPISIYINSASDAYMIGKSMKTYMPFQIKKMKEHL